MASLVGISSPGLNAVIEHDQLAGLPGGAIEQVHAELVVADLARDLAIAVLVAEVLGRGNRRP